MELREFLSDSDRVSYISQHMATDDSSTSSKKKELGIGAGISEGRSSSQDEGKGVLLDE